MAKLILSLDGMVLREIKLDRDKMKIGRKGHNEIQIDNLAVSGEHAQITTIQNDAFIEDLESTNGTLVNGQPIQKHFLQDGDVIEIGKYKLKYVREAARGASPEDFEKTMVIRPPSAGKPATPIAPNPVERVSGSPSLEADTMLEATRAAPEPAPERVAAIQVLTGANTGKTLDLVKNITSIGKPGVQVAILTKRPTGFFITHVEGPNRPLVNGTQIGLQAHALNDHDVIELAGIKMEFFYK